MINKWREWDSTVIAWIAFCEYHGVGTGVEISIIKFRNLIWEEVG